MRKFGIVVACLCLLAETTVAASLEKAALLRRHNLLPQAKTELIDIIFSPASDATKASAYYDLGSIAFEERNISGALDTWTQLLQKYPSSESAKVVKDRAKDLAEIVGEASKTTLDNVVAQSYLRHAEFWSEHKDDIFTVDASWIPNVEAATKWYDKVIAEYPKTTASRLAYEGKLRTLLGWREPGQYGETYGVKGHYETYMPQLLAALAAFEADHPDASTLQAFRYQIAQAYWSHKDWAKTREWLNTVITKAGDGESFYKDLALRRLEKVEF